MSGFSRSVVVSAVAVVVGCAACTSVSREAPSPSTTVSVSSVTVPSVEAVIPEAGLSARLLDLLTANLAKVEN